MSGVMHPSVLIAETWTSRGEQVEEERARQAVYTTEKIETGPRQSLTKTSVNEVDSADKPSATQRARRPWEWSAKDCEIVLVDALSCPPERRRENKVSPQDRSGKTYETVDESYDLDGSGESTNVESGWASRPNVGFAKGSVEIDEQQPPSQQVRDGMDPPIGRRAKEALIPEPLRSGRCSASGSVDDLRCAYPNARSATCAAATHQNLTSRGHEQTERTPVSGSNKTRKGTADSPTCSVTVGQNTDEITARALSTELNRNVPRRRRSCRGNHPAQHAGTSLVEKAAAGGTIHTTQLSGKADPRDARSAVAAGHGLDGHPWTSKGLDFCPGTTAEVWWDDAWYRCRLSSIAAGGRLGVLEFLPSNPRKKSRGAREYSTQLELDEWINSGHLVLPGNHLLWD